MVIQLGEVPINKVLPFVRGKKSKETIEFFGETFHLRSRRFRVLKKKGYTCVACGAKGEYFSVEKHVNDYNYQLVLYAKNKKGEYVPMTADHKYPRSKGGRNRMKNLQPMCAKCNHKKADKV